MKCEDFLRSIASRQPPLTNGETGLRVLRVLEAAQRSLEGGDQPISLKEEMNVGERAGTLTNRPFYVHPTATIDAAAKIGNSTRIWHYSHVMSGTDIGRDCVIGQNVFVAAGTRISNRVKIQNNVSVYEGVELQDYVFCGPSMVFTNVMNPRGHVERKNEFRKTLVKLGATLGANCTIVCGNSIGKYAFVGAGSVVTKDVPDFALAVGVPARVVGWVCECGIKLNFVNERAICEDCGSRYRRDDLAATVRENA